MFWNKIHLIIGDTIIIFHVLGLSDGTSSNYSHTWSVGVWGKVSRVDMVAERVVLGEVPCFATFHVEFLEPPKEHDQDKDELSTIAPSTWKSNPWIFAHTIVFQLSFAAVSHWEPHVPISTAHVSHNIYLTQFAWIQHIAEREKRKEGSLPDDF